MEELDESFEAIRNGSGSESDTSFTSAESASASEGSPASAALSLSPESVDTAPVELGRGKRRASMSAVPAPAKVVAPKPVKVAVAPAAVPVPVPVVSAPAAVHDCANEFEESEVTSMNCVSGTTRRRQSSVPAPVKSSTRRSSLAPKLSATAAALKAVAEIAAAAPVQPVLVPTKVSKTAESTSRITRRKSVLLSSAPAALSAIPETAEAEVDSAPDAESADVESDRLHLEVVTEVSEQVCEPVSAPVQELTMPTVDTHFDDSNMEVPTAAASQRRALQRRTSTSGSAIPQLGDARSSRRKSMANVHAMLASMSSLTDSAPVPAASATASTTETTSLKKRGAAATDEEVSDENIKRRKASNSRMSLSSVAEVDEAPQHVWIDI